MLPQVVRVLDLNVVLLSPETLRNHTRPAADICMACSSRYLKRNTLNLTVESNGAACWFFAGLKMCSLLWALMKRPFVRPRLHFKLSSLLKFCLVPSNHTCECVPRAGEVFFVMAPLAN